MSLAQGTIVRVTVCLTLALVYVRLADAADLHSPMITDFGANVVSQDNAAAIQRALAAAHASGDGPVVVPAGRFLSGPLLLLSGVELHLAKGAVLVMAGGPDDYPSEKDERPAFITIADAENIRITGEGTIDGNGSDWWNNFLQAKAAKQDFRRPQLIKIDRCKNVEVSGITTINPPNTHVSARDSSDLVFRNLTMTAPDESPNTDALNLGRVKHVLIERCTISTGDDNVAIIASGKPGDGPATADITIRDCTFGFGHGLSIGSYTSAGIEKLRVERVTFDGTTSGIRLKASADRGGLVRDLSYRGLTMKNVRYPIFIASHYPKLPSSPHGKTATGPSTPRWSDTLIEDVTIRDCRNGPIVWGLPDAPVENLTLRNVSITAGQGGVFVYAKAVFENVSIKPESGPPLRLFDATVAGMAGAPLSDSFKAK